MAGKQIFLMKLTALFSVAALLCTGCGYIHIADTSTYTTADTEEVEPMPQETTYPAEEKKFWTVGFGSAEIAVPENPATPLYIAGYNQGWEYTDILDLQRANAIWLEAEEGGMLIISIDCVALSSNFVKEIRSRLSAFSAETGCRAVNVVSTHTHAGLDTLGLWGPVGVDGKNEAFMENLMQAAVKAAQDAYADRSQGTLGFASVDTLGVQYDSRLPRVYDSRLYQLRFTPADESQNGVRVIVYDAHAESLRGANKKLSRDYPGVMSDIIAAETGEDMLFLPGAVGGLIMTDEMVSPFDAERNLEATGRKLADFALSMKPEYDLQLEPKLNFATVSVDVPVDNKVFIYYKSLNILQNEIKVESDGSYVAHSELNAVSLGGKEGVLLNLVPGEIFPELVSGKGLGQNDPTAMSDIAEAAGYSHLLVVGLANDELGYIVPPSDFIVHPTNPYFERYTVNGEDHYEETNSVGPLCAPKLAEAFAEALKVLGN